MASTGNNGNGTGKLPLMVFGYGSLMWNPGFDHEAAHTGRLRGYHRAYMMYSTRNRGCCDLPGMVLSLAPGGECVGRAYTITPGREAEALEYLDKREGVGRAHRRVTVPIQFVEEPGQPWRPVLTYLPILTYSNYIPQVPMARQAELVAKGAGSVGTSYDYLRQLMEELDRMRLPEPTLQRLFEEATAKRKIIYNGNPPPPGM